MSEFRETPSLAFRGDRDYLHGSTLFDTLYALTDHPEHGGSLDFVFVKRTSKLVAVVDTDPGAEAPIVATLSTLGRKLWAVETDEPIVFREPYDEDGVVSTLRVKDRTIEVDRQSLAQSFATVAIAAFKSLLKKEHPALRVVFARLKLDHMPAGKFTITYTRMIGGRFFEGRIDVASGVAGFIYFGTWS